MTAMCREKKKGCEHKALRIRPLLGRAMRIVEIPLDKWHKVKVNSECISIENDEETFEINKQPGLFDEGIIITGDKV